MKKANTIKYVGPSKKMADALEEEGLRINWPPTGNIEDKELLAIDAIFETGEGWEKSVLIDLRNMLALDSKAGVDDAIANQLQEEYDNFDIDEEMKIHLEGSAREREKRGVPDAARLLEDMKEQKSHLERFAAVANAVMNGKPIPAKEDDAEITVRGKDAKRVCDLLEKIAYFHASGPWNDEERAFAKMIGNEIRNKIKANM